MGLIIVPMVYLSSIAACAALKVVKMQIWQLSWRAGWVTLGRFQYIETKAHTCCQFGVPISPIVGFELVLERRHNNVERRIF